MNRDRKVRQDFCYALQALAVEPEQQVATLAPACVMCELREDYASTLPRFLRNAGEALGAQVHAVIHELSASLDQVPAQDLACFDHESLTRPAWQAVRSAAREVLSALGWPLRVPPPYEEGRPGVWRRPTAARRNMDSARRVFRVSLAVFCVSLTMASLPDPSILGLDRESSQMLFSAGASCLAFVASVLTAICGFSLLADRHSRQGARLAAQGRGSS